MIVAYEEAIIAVSSGAVQSFSLDTGQSRQLVTKKNISTLSSALEAAYALLAALEARLYGASIQAVPGW